MKRFSFDSIASWILAVVVPLSVVFFYLNPAFPVAATKVTLLALGVVLAFIAYVVARLVRGNIVVPPLMLFGFVWLVPLAYLLSTLFSGVGLSRAFFGTELETDTFGFVLLLALVASLTALALREREHYRRFFIALAAAFSVLLITQIGFILAAQVFSSVPATTTLIGSFADMGVFVGLGVVLSLLALRSLTLGKRVTIALWAGIIVGLLLLVISNSISVWIVVALGAGALFIDAVMQRRKHNHGDLEGVSMLTTPDASANMSDDPKQLAAPLVVLLVSLFFLVGGATLANTAASSIGINVIDVRPSWQSTFAVGGHTFSSSPLFGSGPSTFGEKWLLFRDRALNDTVFWNIDFASGIGYIPTSFITTGVFGVLAWLAFLGLFLYSGFRALLFRLPEEPFVRFVSLASFAGTCYVLALAFVSVPGPMVLASGFALLGVFISTLRFGKGKQEWGIVFSHAPRIGFVIVFLLTLSLLGAVATTYVIAERYFSTLAYTQATVAYASGDIDRAEKDALHSVSLVPSDRGYRLLAALGIERMGQIANNPELSQTAAQEQFQGALSNSIAAALESTRIGSTDYQNWTMLGNVYRSVTVLNIDGAYESARDAYAQAQTLNPTTPVLPYILAQLEVSEGNLAAAEEQADAAVNLKRDYIPALLLFSQLKIQLGKAAEALQLAEAAVYFAPNDSAVLFQVGVLRSGLRDIDGAIDALSRAVEINPQYANARYFLSAMYAMKGDLDAAVREMHVVADFSPENATAVASDLSSLEAGKNPFTFARLASFGVPQPPVSEPTPTEQDAE